MAVRVASEGGSDGMASPRQSEADRIRFASLAVGVSL